MGKRGEDTEGGTDVKKEGSSSVEEGKEKRRKGKEAEERKGKE